MIPEHPDFYPEHFAFHLEPFEYEPRTSWLLPSAFSLRPQNILGINLEHSGLDPEHSGFQLEHSGFHLEHNGLYPEHPHFTPTTTWVGPPNGLRIGWCFDARDQNQGWDCAGALDHARTLEALGHAVVHEDIRPVCPGRFNLVIHHDVTEAALAQ